LQVVCCGQRLLSHAGGTERMFAFKGCIVYSLESVLFAIKLCMALEVVLCLRSKAAQFEMEINLTENM
jgi:hypothetical protein